MTAMTMVPVAQTRDVISFGLFSLVASERLLMKEGTPVELGGRTLDTLIALVSRPNEIVGKRELMAQVWPDVTVEEGSLRAHIASLRKVLGDGKDGARYIATLAGRGYCFVAPVSPATPRTNGMATDVALEGTSFLPVPLGRSASQEDIVRPLSNQYAASRIVTIVGPSGVGKTPVAVLDAHGLLEAFAGAVVFIDLGALNDPDLAAASLASMLKPLVRSNDPTPSAFV